MKIRRLWYALLAAAALATLGALVTPIKAQNPGGAAGQGVTTSRELPSWAYPVPFGPRPTGENTPVEHVPGSKVGYTTVEVWNQFGVSDWFPDSHPAMPEVVSHGRKPDVWACGYCHLANGQGRPENASVSGLSVGYIVQQMADFKNGVRKSSEPQMRSVSNMINLSVATSDEDVKASAAYFSSIQPRQWIRVVETDVVPKTRATGGMLVPTGAGMEPIGERIVEVPENVERTDLRDSTSGYVAYAPTGSLLRGRELVTTGGAGKTIQCSVCHGSDLRGTADVPSIAGRSPSQMARQIIDMQTGARHGQMAQAMKPAISKLGDNDIVDIAAYLASLKP